MRQPSPFGTLFALALPSQGRVAEGRVGSVRQPPTSPPIPLSREERGSKTWPSGSSASGGFWQPAQAGFVAAGPSGATLVASLSAARPLRVVRRQCLSQPGECMLSRRHVRDESQRLDHMRGAGADAGQADGAQRGNVAALRL